MAKKSLSFWLDFQAFCSCTSKFNRQKSHFLFCPIPSLCSCNNFIILLNLSGEKVDFFLARMDFLASYNDFLILLNVSGEKVIDVINTIY